MLNKFWHPFATAQSLEPLLRIEFWVQDVRTRMRHKVYASYDLGASVVDGRAQIVVDALDSDDKFVNEMETKLEVINSKYSKVKETSTMSQTAAGRYAADCAVD